jgi:hypothetical protein
MINRNAGAQEAERKITPEEQAANHMSDHHAQVNKDSSVVSQNLQGPYAIKRGGPKNPYWTLDLPKSASIQISDENKDVVLPLLTKYSGMSQKDCEALLDAMILDNRALEPIKGHLTVVENYRPETEEGAKRARQSILKIRENLKKEMDNSKVKKFFAKKKSTYPGIGEPLGQGSYRFSIESNKQYEYRMQKQIGYLKDSIKGGANVLCFQEQFYDLPQDEKRKEIFERVMEKHGYRQVGFLANRDVGTWAKKVPGSENSFQNIAPMLGLLEKETGFFGRTKKGVEYPITYGDVFRGCFVGDEEKNIIYANLHAYTRGISNEKYIEMLGELKQELSDKYPNMTLVICGDLNLHQLTDQEVQELTGQHGFTVTPVKGQVKGQEKLQQNQHRSKKLKLNYEACVFPDPKKLQQKEGLAMGEEEEETYERKSEPEERKNMNEEEWNLDDLTDKQIHDAYNSLKTMTDNYLTNAQHYQGDIGKYSAVRELRDTLNKNEDKRLCLKAFDKKLSELNKNKNVVAHINHHRNSAFTRYIGHVLSVLKLIFQRQEYGLSPSRYPNHVFWKPKSRQLFHFAQQEIEKLKQLKK